MIKNVLTDIGGVEVYGIISICLFFVVFTGAMLWAASLQKPFLKSMSQLPLNDGETATPAKGNSHE
jgi:hypothetical protein